ncbi:ABC transporter substrate-binding protein [Stomatohabitans albus]|uniref:ABC transporter substrate-binding protein n=1 Tax=Stomatohabitans albus TaxID=3110766 RepID=UPI00300D2D8A
MHISKTGVLLASIAAVSLTACNAGQTTTPAQSDASSGTQQEATTDGAQDSVTAALVDPPKNLDFTATAGAAIPTLLMNNVYETLVTTDLHGTFNGLLAKEWEISPDGKTYTFKLVDNATFSTGEPFNAQTAKFTLDRLRNNEWANNKDEPMMVMESVEAPDDTTLVVQLSKPSQQFLFLLSTHVGAMMHPDHIDNLEQNAVGTGPYKIGEFVAEQKAVLEARDDARQPVDVKTATFRYISDATTAVNALRSGDVDILWSMQATQQLDSLKADYNVMEGATTNKVLLIFNNAAPPFDKVEARKAVASAIDTDALITASDGRGTPLTAPVATTDPWSLSDGGPVFDLDAARSMASASGLTSFAMKVPTLPYAQSAAELVNAQLSAAGISTTIESAEFPAVWLDEVYKNRNYQATIIAHVEPRDLPGLVRPEYYWGVQDASLVQKLEDADAMIDPDASNTAMQAVVKEIQDQMLVVPLYQLPNTVVTRKSISGVQADQPIPNLNMTTIEVE